MAPPKKNTKSTSPVAGDKAEAVAEATPVVDTTDTVHDAEAVVETAPIGELRREDFANRQPKEVPVVETPVNEVAPDPAPEKGKVTVSMAPISGAEVVTKTLVPAFHGLVIKRLPNAAGLPDIAYQTEGAAGMDLTAAIPANEPVIIPPGSRATIGTGLAMAIPVGFEAQIRPRSGLAKNFGITCLNSPGTIDSDYRGEVGVILHNTSNNTFRVNRGDRIAQIVFAAVARMPIQYTDGELPSTARGAGGFGHTGV